MAAQVNKDRELDAALIVRAREAAARWQGRKGIRDKRAKALKDNRPFDADSRERLAQRVNRLVSDVRASARRHRAPDNPTLKQLIERPTPVTTDELTEDLLKEVVLGARNFLSVEFLERGIQAAKSVGRIVIQTSGGPRPRGTGFLVGPGLVLTNEHVLTSRDLAAACLIEMDYEQNLLGPSIQSQIFQLEPQRFFLNDRALDFALVAVSDRSARGAGIGDYGWLMLQAAQGKIAVSAEDYLNIVQHPQGRHKEVVIRDNKLLDLVTGKDNGDMGPFVHYEGDTEKGSSGSPVFNDQWDVVALHHSGVPKVKNGKWLNKDGGLWNEKTQTLADVLWIANEGVRVSSLVAAFDQAKVLPHEQPVLQRLLAQPKPVRGPIAHDRREAFLPVTEVGGMSNSGGPETKAVQYRSENLEFEVPLRISVSLGTARGQTLTGLRRPPQDELLLERLDPEEYADRKGYDRRFLGINVPLPTMKQTTRFGSVLTVPRPARPRDKHELPYHRFSVIMNKLRRLAYLSACNVNFDPPATASRDEGTGSWRLDPRLDNGQQLGAAYYDHNPYDKGHLTRRDDAAWGRDKEDALAANWDTFHYTNSGPQHELFNRSDDFTGAGLDLWGDLENHISEQGGAQRTRLSIFNGPIFGANDKPFKDALVPLSYFKIVVWKDRNQPPAALGFVLEQQDLLGGLAEEAIEAGRFAVRQKRIKTIEDLLDIRFGVVTDWDRMPPPSGRRRTRGGAQESLEEEGILLTSVNDIDFGGKAPGAKRKRR